MDACETVRLVVEAITSRERDPFPLIRVGGVAARDLYFTPRAQAGRGSNPGRAMVSLYPGQRGRARAAGIDIDAVLARALPALMEASA